MSWGLVAVAGATLVGGVMSSDAQRSAGNKAADAQTAAAQAGIAEQEKQFTAVQQLLSPYVQAGNGALTAQQNLMGIGPGGTQGQQSAIDALQAGPQFQSMLKAGTNALLQNASATGGLRGGNLQGAIASFSPSLLAQTIQQQFQNLGSLSLLGQNSAAMTGTASLQTGQGISNLLQQQGSAQAGADLNAGKADQNMYSAFTSALGQLYGMGGFGKTPGATPSSAAPYTGGGLDYSWGPVKLGGAF